MHDRAVDAAVGEQSHEVQRAAARAARARRLARSVSFSANSPSAIAVVDDGNALRHDAPAAEIHVPDFAVAHDAFRQADGFARRRERRPRIAFEERAPMRQAWPRRSRCRASLAAAPSVEHGKDDGPIFQSDPAAAAIERCEAVGIERRAADQAAVDVRQRYVRRDVDRRSCCRRRESALLVSRRAPARMAPITRSASSGSQFSPVPIAQIGS